MRVSCLISVGSFAYCGIHVSTIMNAQTRLLLQGKFVYRNSPVTDSGFMISPKQNTIVVHYFRIAVWVEIKGHLCFRTSFSVCGNV
jgi:hypothetical protein